MKLGLIEVSGITCVVFNRQSVWNRSYQAPNGEWWWYPKNSNAAPVPHKKMVDRLKRLISGEKAKIWVHGNCINVVTR